MLGVSILGFTDLPPPPIDIVFSAHTFLSLFGFAKQNSTSFVQDSAAELHGLKLREIELMCLEAVGRVDLVGGPNESENRSSQKALG